MIFAVLHRVCDRSKPVLYGPGPVLVETGLNRFQINVRPIRTGLYQSWSGLPWTEKTQRPVSVRSFQKRKKDRTGPDFKTLLMNASDRSNCRVLEHWWTGDKKRVKLEARKESREVKRREQTLARFSSLLIQHACDQGRSHSKPPGRQLGRLDTQPHYGHAQHSIHSPLLHCANHANPNIHICWCASSTCPCVLSTQPLPVCMQWHTQLHWAAWALHYFISIWWHLGGLCWAALALHCWFSFVLSECTTKDSHILKCPGDVEHALLLSAQLLTY